MQFHNDIIKYKLQISELEAQQRATQNQAQTKERALQDQNEKVVADMKQEYEESIKRQKNLVNSFKMELEMERTQMSAQEEMLHSLVHNISLEFASVNSKTTRMRKVDQKEQPVYQNN